MSRTKEKSTRARAKKAPIPPTQLHKRRRAKTKFVDAQAPIQPKPGVPLMMGSHEVSKALGVRVQNLQFIPDLPLPHQRIASTRLWVASEIEEFAKTRHTVAA